MLLAHATIENFRGIRALDMDLDPVTALIGENNFGKTSILDALAICLGAGAEGTAFAFEPGDFHEPAEKGAAAGGAPIRIVLTFEAADDGDAIPDTSPLRKAVLAGPSRRTRLRLAVEATREDGGIRTVWSFADASGKPLAGATGPEPLLALRRRYPMLLLRSDAVGVPEAESDRAKRLDTDGGEGRRRRLEAEILRAYRTLRGTRTEPRPSDIARAVAAADRLYGPGVPWPVATAAQPPRLIEALVEAPGSMSPDTVRRDALRRAGSGTRSVAQLAVVGAMLAARGDRQFASDAHPIVALEDPEVHLHPVMLASLWELIARVPAQKIISTNSGELLASIPMHSVRRLERRPQRVHVHRLHADTFSLEELRRLGYHIRVNRASAMFARCWLLVEGETEFWLLPELARQCGYHFPAEGVRCLEFAQCGVEPLIKLAAGLGIPWHLLADGDLAGRGYAELARERLGGAPAEAHITQVRHRDIELCLWNSGYAEVYRRAARLVDKAGRPLPPGRNEKPAAVIARAIRAVSKPRLALDVAEAANAAGSPGVPPVLRGTIEAAVRLARSVGR